MGNLYGSEYWTYTLPRRVGAELAEELTYACLPVGTAEACEMGLIDAAFGTDVPDFERRLSERADALAKDTRLSAFIADKQRRKRADEHQRPLASYRAVELAHMAENFFGADRRYHEARHRFVHKLHTHSQADETNEQRGTLRAA
jgi:putative two-component system hydrogenase maturation factor HypX/HoxX